MRLRLGADLFPGQSSDLSAGGIGMRLGPQSPARTLDGALANHEHGALELWWGDLRFLARVRFAHAKSSRAGIYVGVAFDSSKEAERLIRGLRAYGVPSAAQR